MTGARLRRKGVDKEKWTPWPTRTLLPAVVFRKFPGQGPRPATTTVPRQDRSGHGTGSIRRTQLEAYASARHLLRAGSAPPRWKWMLWIRSPGANRPTKESHQWSPCRRSTRSLRRSPPSQQGPKFERTGHNCFPSTQTADRCAENRLCDGRERQGYQLHELSGSAVSSKKILADLKSAPRDLVFYEVPLAGQWSIRPMGGKLD